MAWAYGGDHGGQWRGAGCFVAVWVMNTVKFWGVPYEQMLGLVSGLFLWGATTIGYGVNAPLTKFFAKHSRYPKVLVRTTVGGLYGLSVGFPKLWHLNSGWTVIWFIVLFNTLFWSVILPKLIGGNLPPLVIGKWKLNMEEFMIGVGVGYGGVLCLL